MKGKIMKGKIKLICGILNENCIRIVYIDGATDISLDEFLSNNPQIKIIGEIEPYYEAYKYLFETMGFDERKFNIIYSTIKNI